MISRLPPWILWGASVLAFVAGIVNAVGFLGFQHQGVTHLTGTSTLAGIAAARLDGLEVLHLLTVIGAFVGGAVLSGIIVQDSTLHLGRRYGAALLVESLLLGVAVPLLRRQSLLGDYLASAACGLQNAMASTYSGAVLRTTHVSGIFTDLGIFIGHLLRGIPVDWRRFRLWIGLLTGFFGGGACGALLFARWEYAALYLPASLTGLGALHYGVYREWRRRHPRRDVSPG